MTDAATKQLDPRLRSMSLSLGVSAIMLVGKVGAYLMTGSAAILSDAAESVVHVLATALVAVSLWYTLRPADTSHPYGHGKAAYFSAGFEGGMIVIAALAITYAAIRSLIRGPELEQLGIGLFIIAGLTVINLVLGLYLVRTGRRTNSLVLVSNGRHVLTDMWTSVGVVVGVFIVWVTGVVWIDPIVAIIVAVNILFTGFSLIRESFRGLMEEVDPSDTNVLIAELERAREKGFIAGYHQVRHRRVDDQRWIEYHLLFPDEIKLSEAHDRSHRVEERVIALFPNDVTVVTAHLEPNTHDLAHPDGHVEPRDPLTSSSPTL